jgi:hypothetical protein
MTLAPCHLLREPNEVGAGDIVMMSISTRRIRAKELSASLVHAGTGANDCAIALWHPGSASKRDPSPALGQACPGSEQGGPARVAQLPSRATGSEGIGAGCAVGTDSAAGSGAQADDFQGPDAASDLEALVEPTTRGTRHRGE